MSVPRTLLFDITEPQTALAHVMLGELTASIAHEVNQPLAAVVTNGEAGLRWLAREPADLSEARKAIERVISDGKRASEVIRRLRALARKTDPERTRLNLRDVVGDTIQLVRPELLRHRVSLSLQLEASLLPVIGDRVQLQQVLLNLVVNAMDAMAGVEEQERSLRIRGHLDEQGGRPAVTIDVEDRGVGLQAEETNQIFDAFYTTKPHGLGLGLAISRSIIEEHGGRLWAGANGERGATFSFRLPAADVSSAV